MNPESLYSFEELDLPVTGIYLGDRLRPYIIFNMVASVDGKTTTNASGLDGLGSPTDRMLMNRLRSQVDGILVGGNTLRTDPFIPTVSDQLMPERLQHFSDRPQPLGIVVSRQGNLPLDHRFWQAGKELRLVFVSTAIEPQQLQKLEQRSQVRQISTNSETGDLDLAELLGILYAEFGIKRLLIESGATFNYALLAQNYGDELFLTISPHLVGGIENLTVLAGAGHGFGKLKDLELKSCYPIDNHLFLRYRLINLSTGSEKTSS
jgi:2,5-diamino-6-(ribosylamino)-4(3H)-pyrimidinone 5'-phosphate reductase